VIGKHWGGVFPVYKKHPAKVGMLAPDIYRHDKNEGLWVLF